MGGCASTSNHSTCSSRSNGERVSPECLGISMFSRKRIRKTFSDPVTTLQHLTSIPNRIFKNGKSRTSCIFTQQGRKGINQDAMVVWEDFMAEDVTFCGVFDGHGPHGHLVARKVRDALPLKLASFLQSFDSKHNGSTANCCSGDKKLDVVDPDKDGGMEDKVDYLWREAFLKSYKAMDKELRSHPNLDCFCSGSTAITLVKQGSNLFMGYIGDSRAIMASKDSNDSMVAVQLTVDLKPDLPKEAERIKRCKGRVFALQDEPEVQRVWLPFDDAPGLAMARAFGDFCLKEYGVISVPEFSHHILTERDKFIVLASDGVWDVLSNEEVIEIVSSAPTRASGKPINSSDSARRLQKRKTKVQFLDIELDFDNGKYFALLRLSRGLRGILEAAVFTSYTLENNTEFSLFCFPANHKLVTRHAGENIASLVSPELGSYLPPRSIKSWLSKCHKVHITLLDERASKAPLNLDVLSGLTGLNLEVEGEYGSKTVTKLGVSLKPSASKAVPLQVVSMHPRYVILNESDEIITVRQCFVEEDGTDTVVTLNSKQRTALTLRSRNEITTMKRNPFLQNFLKKHAKPHNDSSFFVQFQPNKANFSWSGPVCIASLGRFFLKFKKSSDSVQQSDLATQHNSDICEFATVHVVEDGPTIVLRFCWPANIDLPYRIENHLENTSITYYQKGLPEPEVLASGSIAGYVWDDLRLDHKLIVQIDALHLQREINLDKVREWKPFYRIKQQRGLGLHLPLEKKPEDPKKNWFRQLTGLEINKLGFEVYAEGLTRVLRICEFSDRRRGDTSFHSCTKMQLRISCFAIQLLERAKQDVVDKDKSNALIYNPIILARLNRIDFDAVFAEKHKLNHLRVQSLSVEPKWIGAPFASMLRRHHVENIDTNDRVLRVGLVLAASSSSVKHVQHLSIVLQPLDFNLDEETLMRIVPFWRTSLRDTNTPSQKYYIDHFEIHPVKVVASFLPGESYANHSSTQETLRSLLHSVIKIPPVKNMTVELNGILVTHALVTLRELSIKCAQHYSWYAMRAVYIAKGSPLLPPAFASIFDDLASSSLDVFFDPSTGHLNLPGLTIGTFKLIRKCIDGKEFSGTKRYFGDLGKTFKSAGSNILFAAVTEISDSVLKGAEASGLNGMVNGFHQGILKLAMEPTLLGSAFMEGGPDRKIGLDRSPGVDELYIEGYLQAMLDTLYKQEYLRVRVIDNQVILKNLPPSSSLIEEIVERVKGFLVSKTLLKGDTSTAARPLRHMRGEREWRVVPTVLTLCEHLFVSFAIRMLRKQASKAVGKMNWKQKVEGDDEKAIVPASGQKLDFLWKWGFGNFVLSGILAYVDGRLCRYISNPIARRIVSGFLLSFLERNE